VGQKASLKVELIDSILQNTWRLNMGKYSTEKENPLAVEGEEWEQLIDKLPKNIDLEESARRSGALRRRRKVKRASDLLRMVMAYVACDWSLKMVGIWSVIQGMGDLSAVAVRQRLRGCEKWMGVLVGAVLQAHLLDVKYGEGIERMEYQEEVRIRLMDATCISEPGSSGTDWRLHLSLDVGNLCIEDFEITDCHGGESFARFPSQAGDIRIGDRGYAYAKSLGPVLEENEGLVVRIGWQNLPLEDTNGQRIDLIRCLRQLKETTGEWEVFLQTPQGRFQLRLVVGALPQAAADKARHRIRKIYQKKGKTPDQRTLYAAGFVMLVTNLPISSWSIHTLLKIYRVRWQVELLFKRMKSILHLDNLRAFDSALAKTYLLGKLLVAVLADQFIHTVRACLLAGFTNPRRPISPWLLTVLFSNWLTHAVRGQIALPLILASLPSLERFLCNTPRKRPSQLVQALAFLADFSGC
jgi:hypothetical protein